MNCWYCVVGRANHWGRLLATSATCLGAIGHDFSETAGDHLLCSFRTKVFQTKDDSLQCLVIINVLLNLIEMLSLLYQPAAPELWWFQLFDHLSTSLCNFAICIHSACVCVWAFTFFPFRVNLALHKWRSSLKATRTTFRAPYRYKTIPGIDTECFS